MAKKKQAPRPRVWEHQDQIELLAYLDFTLEHKLDFKSTVGSHLATVTGKHFNERQISGKLKRAWFNHGRSDGNAGSDQDLLSEGSSFLVGWTESDHEELRQALARLQPPASRSRSVTRQSSAASPLSEHATPEFDDCEYTQVAERERTKVSYEVCRCSSFSSSPSFSCFLLLFFLSSRISSAWMGEGWRSNHV